MIPTVFKGHPWRYNDHQPTSPFAVVVIEDADTFTGWLDLGYDEYVWRTIRLEGFDAPEISRPRNQAELEHGLQAKGYVEYLFSRYPLVITTKKVRTTTWDRYVAQVQYLKEGIWRDLAGTLRTKRYEKRASYV